jgi:hypothetical protein
VLCVTLIARAGISFFTVTTSATFLVTPALYAAPTAEAPAGDDAASDMGKRALQGSGALPWYDASKDDLRRIDVSTQAEDKSETRNSNCQSQSTPYKPPVTSNPWVPFMGELFRGLIYVILAALIAALVIYLVRAYLDRESDKLTNSSADDKEELAGDIKRVENLPFQVNAPKGDLLSEAERCYRAGDYSRAIVYLFSYELVRLDKTHVIRLTRGKTNRQYVREARAKPELSAILNNTMMAFEDVFFGHHPLDRERFEACWQELDAFQRLTSPEVEVAV